MIEEKKCDFLEAWSPGRVIDLIREHLISHSGEMGQGLDRQLGEEYLRSQRRTVLLLINRRRRQEGKDPLRIEKEGD